MDGQGSGVSMVGHVFHGPYAGYSLVCDHCECIVCDVWPFHPVLSYDVTEEMIDRSLVTTEMESHLEAEATQDVTTEEDRPTIPVTVLKAEEAEEGRG